MKHQAVNPFLPVTECIPDGEPHVFGERVYLYGSHDALGGETFCMLPYVVWSAPVEDLSDWSNPGVAYDAKQDPLWSRRRPYMYAPDCVRGGDGRYYLYYALSGGFGKGGYDGPISVAVSDRPDGPFDYYGVVRKRDGTAFNDVVLFDPAVLNDDGVIRLYFGTCYDFDNHPAAVQEIFTQKKMGLFHRSRAQARGRGEKSVMGAFTVTLDSDMLTVTSAPARLMPSRTRGTEWAQHPFFEASAIRKIGEMYYFVYSSQRNHELCYAVSRRPDGDFRFGGVIVSNGDVGYQGRRERDRLNHTGTNHGCIECIRGRWYVFYHRQTHGTDYSRQACAEEIQIMPDGSIPQVEVTSCGLNGAPLRPEGEFSAAICCNLTDGAMPHGCNKVISSRHPRITSRDGQVFVGGMGRGARAVYKYFDLREEKALRVVARGSGTLRIQGVPVRVESPDWAAYTRPVSGGPRETLTLEVTEGRVDLLSLGFEEV